MSTLTEEMLLTKTHRESLGEIKSVTLWGANLEDVSIFSKLPNIESISLSINKVTTLAPFSSCVHLRELYLRKNKISDLSELQHLKGLNELRLLWLADNPCSMDPDYRNTVIKVLPQLHRLDQEEISDIEREALGLKGIRSSPKPKIIQKPQVKTPVRQEPKEDIGLDAVDAVVHRTIVVTSPGTPALKQRLIEGEGVLGDVLSAKSAMGMGKGFDDMESPAPHHTLERTPPSRQMSPIKYFSNNNDDKEKNQDESNTSYPPHDNQVQISPDKVIDQRETQEKEESTDVGISNVVEDNNYLQVSQNLNPDTRETGGMLNILGNFGDKEDENVEKGVVAPIMEQEPPQETAPDGSGVDSPALSAILHILHLLSDPDLSTISQICSWRLGGLE